MLNPFGDVNWNPAPPDLRRFARSLIIGFPVIAVALFLIGGGPGEWEWRGPAIVAASGVVAGLAFMARSSLARPAYLLWYFVACCIGFVISNAVLAVTYFVI